MNPALPLASQPISVLVALWRQLAHPVGRDGKVTPGARRILEAIHARGYPLRDLER